MLHFEGVEMNKAKNNGKKRIRKEIDTEMADNISVAFSNLHVLSYQNLKILRLMDVVLEAKFFK